MNTGKVLVGLIAGFAAGASLGIILAPAKGSETRKRFLRKPVEENPLIEKFIEFLNSVSENRDVDKVADELITDVKSTVSNLAEEKKIMETESGAYKI